MGVGAGLYMYVVVAQKFTFAISSPDEFLSLSSFPCPVRQIKLASRPLLGARQYRIASYRVVGFFVLN